MGQVQITTPNQTRILDLVAGNRSLSQNFYYTGGTALSEYYLKHRYSQDLDFFSGEKIEQELILSLMNEWAAALDFRFTSRFVEVVYRFDLRFSDSESFKVDFSHYPYPRIEKSGKKYKSLDIDSLRDMAANKLLTVNQRTDAKDYVDLYFLLKDHFTIWDLFDSAEMKFKQMIVDRYLTAQDLLKVEDFTVLPKMIKPVTLADLKTFFRDLSQKLAKTAVE